jgi:hypothetical protein
MPIAFVNGTTPQNPKTSEVAAYAAAKEKVAGDRTAQEQAAITSVEAEVTRVAGGWQDSGGTGGRQAAVALDVLDFASRLDGARKQSINQHAEKAQGGAGRQARHAQTEMHGADTEFFIELARLLFELRERLNDSPY